jgi:hypothetical protein
MKLFGACCSLALLATAALAQSPKSQVTGKWIYNVSTLKITFNAAMQARIKKEPDAQGRIAQMKQGLVKQLSGMAVTFRPDGRFIAAVTGSATQVYGKWSMVGRKIKVVMDDQAQKSPQLELMPGGKAIRASFNQPSFGSGSVELIKRKG